MTPRESPWPGRGSSAVRRTRRRRAARNTPALREAPTAPAIPVPVPARWSQVVRARLRRLLRRQLGAGTALAAAASVLLLGAVAAVVLPSARITITPQALPVGPAAYTVMLPATEEALDGSVTAAGLPTGERIDRVAARGAVVFSNWNPVPVIASAGTRLAAGKVEFETTERVVVPAATLGPGLTVVAGQQEAPVAAVEPGETGNVPAKAIETVISQPLRTFLRGFANNDQPLVTNPEPTADGAETAVALVTSQDVDAVVAALRLAAAEQARVAIGSRPERIYAPFDADDLQIQVDVPEGLVGREGSEPFELTASYQATLRYVPLDQVESAARERFARSALPDGYQLLDEATAVRFANRTFTDGGIAVEVTVSGQAAPALDVDALRPRLAGLSAEAATALLAPYGDAEVTLWPSWVATIPDLEWRIELQTASVRRLQ